MFVAVAHHASVLCPRRISFQSVSLRLNLCFTCVHHETQDGIVVSFFVDFASTHFVLLLISKARQTQFGMQKAQSPTDATCASFCIH